MKMKYILLALMALCFASCSKEENIPFSGSQQQAVRVTAGVGAYSRMVLNDQDTYTQSLWQDGDKISLFTSTQSNLVYSTSLNESSAVAEFTYVGDSLKYIEGNTVYACYPEVTSTTEDTLVVNLLSTDTLDYSDGVLRSFCYASDKITDGKLNFKFKHLSAFLFLTVKPEQLTDATKGISTVTVTTSSTSPLSIGEGDTFDFSTQTATTTHGSNSVCVNVGNQVITSDWTVYVPILPQPAGVNITVTMADSDGNVLYTLTKETPATGFVAGYVYKEGITVTHDTAYLVDGPTFNARIKQLANGSELGILEEDYMIENVEFVTEVHTNPEEYIVVSAEGSPAPIYASFNSTNKLLTIFTPAKDMEIVDASSMFSYLMSLSTIDFGNFNVNETTTLTEMMFNNCQALTSLSVSGWDTSNVTSMSYMFSHCNLLASLDVSNWDTSNVTNMSDMFSYCSSLALLDVSGWDTSNVTNMSEMFGYCSSLSSLDVSKWNTANVTDMSLMFCMFLTSPSLASLDVSGWDTSNVTNMGWMFDSFTSLTSLDVSKWNTSNVTYMFCMFADCSGLTSLDVSGWDTSNVTDMGVMFANCSSLVSLDVSGWDTSKVTNMKDMFVDCELLTALDISNWNTSNITSMSFMFYDCSALTSLNASDWDVSNVTDMDNMFGNCSRLENLNIANWGLKDGVKVDNMFNGCASESQSCKVTSTPETKEFLLEKLGDSSMNLDWFIWETGTPG